MLRKTIFITVLVALIFLLYRGISPSGADKIVDKVSSIREKDTTNSLSENTNTGTLNTGNIVNSGTISSGTNDFEKMVKSGTLLELSGDNKTITGSAIKTGNTNTGTNKAPVKATTTNKTSTKTSTNTNGLSQQDMKDLENLLNNIVE